MIPFWRAWFLTRRAYIALFAFAVPAAVSVWIPLLYPITIGLLITYSIVVVIDTVGLWRPGCLVQATRTTGARLNNGEQNSVVIRLLNTFKRTVTATIIDELPVQLQNRTFRLKARIEPNDVRDIVYTFRPVTRGVYSFGAINVFVKGAMGFVERRLRWDADREVAVYPSVKEMLRGELHAFSQRLVRWGTRKQRRIGHTMEFEKIKEYVPGDDQRTINWKATARSGALRVNLYQDERSQDIVSVIDLGRVMQSPFNGMTSLDYAVNATLAFSRVVLMKGDHAGMITYGGHQSSIIRPSGIPAQLGRINEALYNISTEFEESNDEHLILQTRSGLRQRSLIMLYTNIEALPTLRRRLPNLLLIAKRHVLVVALFDNTDIRELLRKPVGSTEDVYAHMVARDYIQQKYDIANELRRHGIHSIIARPEQLSLASIDKYLELKSRGIV